MSLTSIHFLLSYACTYECDHCFVYSSPSAKGTFTVGKLDAAFMQISHCPDIDSVYFEGGEPFLYYPVLLYAVRKAKELGLEVNIVTNCYWALDVDTAVVSLSPFAGLGIEGLTTSEDEFHCTDFAIDRPEGEENLPTFARSAAVKLGISEGTITIDTPTVQALSSDIHAPGEKKAASSVRFRGRAVEKLTQDLPGKQAGLYDECPDEDLVDPKRLHLDVHGNLHICQGLVVGNINRTPLREFIAAYTPDNNPVLKALRAGGPYRLALEAGIVKGPDDGEFVDACHLCYLARKQMMPKYPDILTPPGVYGEEWT